MFAAAAAVPGLFGIGSGLDTGKPGPVDVQRANSKWLQSLPMRQCQNRSASLSVPGASWVTKVALEHGHQLARCLFADVLKIALVVSARSRSSSQQRRRHENRA